MGDGGWVHNGGENTAAGHRHGDRSRTQRAHMSTVSTELSTCNYMQANYMQANYMQAGILLSKPVTCFP